MPRAPYDPPNPWNYYSTIDYLDRVMSITVNWNTSTRNITSMVVYREPGCLYSEILLGEEFDPTIARRIPDTIPEGTTTITANQIRAVGITTIDDLKAAGQITVGFPTTQP